MKSDEDPGTASYIENWNTPKYNTHVYIRKNSMQFNGENLMVYCISLIDDIVLGVAIYKYFEPLTNYDFDIHDNEFYQAVFENLPVAVQVYDEDTNSSVTNFHWRRLHKNSLVNPPIF